MSGFPEGRMRGHQMGNADSAACAGEYPTTMRSQPEYTDVRVRQCLIAFRENVLIISGTRVL
jgi:hypothetical protein